MREAPPFLEALNIRKSFDGTTILRGINLSFEQGQTVCLLGPSGCGKTTLLRILAGLEQADEGQLLLDGQDIISLPAHQREFGLMFQDFALFPHMSVADNISFGLRMRKWPQDRIEKRIGQLLDLVELEGYDDRKVFELSGGQQQRVALARSLAPEPRVLMLDEPLGSLDRALRDQLLAELRQLLQSLEQTTIYVTHDQLEAFAIADRIVLMNHGCVEQDAAPEDLYASPVSTFAARFLGFKNVLEASVIADEPQFLLQTDVGVLQPQNSPPASVSQDSLYVVIRPEGASLAVDQGEGINQLALTLQMRSFRGAHTLLQFNTQTRSIPELAFELPGLLPQLQPGDRVCLQLDPSAIVVLERD